MVGERTNETHGRLRAFVFPCLLVVVGGLVYVNSLNGPFIFDDKLAIVQNENIRQLWPLSRAATSSTCTPVAGRPVVSISMAINYALGGLDVRGYHIVNIAVHVLCSLVLFGIVRRTLRGESLQKRFGRYADFIALACALIWLVHPLQTECVDYVTQRTESIMSLFYLLTLYCAIRAIDSKRRSWWFGASVISCALGMASKEMMVTAPVMVVLYDWSFRTRPFKEVLRQRRGLYAGLAATWGVLAFLMLKWPHTESLGATDVIGPLDYALNQCWVIVHYLRLAVWPHPLIIDYGSPKPLTLAAVAPFALILAGLSIAAVATFFYRPAIGFLGAWFFVILAPTSSVVPIVTEVAAYRRMYLALAGVIVLGVITGYAGLQWIARRPRKGEAVAAEPALGRRERWLGAGLVVAVAAVLIPVTVLHNTTYRDPVSMWRMAVEAVPDNIRACNNLGNELRSRGEFEEAIVLYRQALGIRPDDVRTHNNLASTLFSLGELDEAIELYRQAIRLRPDYARAHQNLAIALGNQGKVDEAISHFRAALRIEPDNPELNFHLGVALQTVGRREEAIAQFRRAVQLQPDHAAAHRNLGVALQRLGELDQAVGHYRRALDVEPGSAATHLNLGVALQARGELDEAREHLAEAARLAPGWPAPNKVLAWILATHPEAAVRNGQEAVRLAERAAALTQNRDPAVLDALAAAYAEAGRFDAATATAQRAIQLASAAGTDGMAGEIRGRLELYRKGQPFRQPVGGRRDNP